MSERGVPTYNYRDMEEFYDIDSDSDFDSDGDNPDLFDPHSRPPSPYRGPIPPPFILRARAPSPELEPAISTASSSHISS